ncbi:protein kinase [Streptomyces sp. NPDC048142]|uniref:protein kinase domain-containing protein n=1 Tax=Streptomyces sp. NPDC048142 TaxID=3365501 RepID=UPI0037217226
MTSRRPQPNRPLPPHRPLGRRWHGPLAHGLAPALQAIHGTGLIHRDLKPSNVLVTVDGPRVIGFGIARAVETLAEGVMTRTSAVIGSPGFMSPEQVRGLGLTSASDVFCPGPVLAVVAAGLLGPESPQDEQGPGSTPVPSASPGR